MKADSQSNVGVEIISISLTNMIMVKERWSAVCISYQQSRGWNCRPTTRPAFSNDIGLWPEFVSYRNMLHWAKRGVSELQHCDDVVMTVKSWKQISVDVQGKTKKTKTRRFRPTLVCFSVEIEKGKLYRMFLIVFLSKYCWLLLFRMQAKCCFIRKRGRKARDARL